jgi:hypothetical protein
VERVDQVDDAPMLIVVRAGATDRFAAMRSAFVTDGIDVIWDRRVGERRRTEVESRLPEERRRRDRRGAVPESWRLLDFLVVPSRLAVS